MAGRGGCGDERVEHVTSPCIQMFLQERRQVAAAEVLRGAELQVQYVHSGLLPVNLRVEA